MRQTTLAILFFSVLLPCAHTQAIANRSATRVIEPYDATAAGFAVRKQVDEVRLLFAVVDEHGRPVPHLTREDFSIVDDRKPVESITEFRMIDDVPLRIALLIDTSDSVQRQFAQEQQAATTLILRLMRPLDEGFAAAFSGKLALPLTLSREAGEMAAAVRRLRNTPVGVTALYDALLEAEQFLAGNSEQAAVRRVLLLLSDGEDNFSLRSLSDVIATAQRANIGIYPICIHPRRNSRGIDVLRQLAAATGGRAWFPSSNSEISKHLDQINDELRAQYMVAYRPVALLPDGRFHAIQITSTRGRKLSVHVASGYYAPLVGQRSDEQ